MTQVNAAIANIFGSLAGQGSIDASALNSADDNAFSVILSALAGLENEGAKTPGTSLKTFKDNFFSGNAGALPDALQALLPETQKNISSFQAISAQFIEEISRPETAALQGLNEYQQLFEDLSGHATALASNVTEGTEVTEASSDAAAQQVAEVLSALQALTQTSYNEGIQTVADASEYTHTLLDTAVDALESLINTLPTSDATATQASAQPAFTSHVISHISYIITKEIHVINGSAASFNNIASDAVSAQQPVLTESSSASEQFGALLSTFADQLRALQRSASDVFSSNTVPTQDKFQEAIILSKTVVSSIAVVAEQTISAAQTLHPLFQENKIKNIRAADAAAASNDITVETSEKAEDVSQQITAISDRIKAQYETKETTETADTFLNEALQQQTQSERMKSSGEQALSAAMIFENEKTASAVAEEKQSTQLTSKTFSEEAMHDASDTLLQQRSKNGGSNHSASSLSSYTANERDPDISSSTLPDTSSQKTNLSLLSGDVSSSVYGKTSDFSMPNFSDAAKQLSGSVGYNANGAKAYAESVTGQISLHISKLQASGDAQSLRVQLRPEELGHVSISLEKRNDGKHEIKISAEQAETLQMMQKNESQLRQTLQEIFKTDTGNMMFSFLHDGHRGSDSHDGAQQHADNNASDTYQEDDELHASESSLEDQHYISDHSVNMTA